MYSGLEDDSLVRGFEKSIDLPCAYEQQVH